MTREEYIENILKTYNLISVLADKNDCKVMHIRHKELQKDLVLHSVKKPMQIYDYLCSISFVGLVNVFDVKTLDDGQVVLEEFIDGLTIAQVMETGLYKYSGAKKVLKLLCQSLTLLHKKGFVHRDIKPENIMIDNNGRVVLIDFNASRKVTVASKDTEVMGTVGYASPEQLGVSQTDARTDIYALGVLLNVMMTGKHPSEELAKGRAGRIVRKCTNVNPNDRFKSVEKLSKAL